MENRVAEEHERPQNERRAGEAARQTFSETGKQENKKIPLTFLNNSSTTLSTPTLHSLSPLCAPTSYYFSPVLLSSENRPEARHSPGWLTPKQSPCSSHAGNKLSLLKEPRLLEGSTRKPPPPPPSSPCLTLSASKASAVLPQPPLLNMPPRAVSPPSSTFLCFPGPHHLLIPPP